MTPLVGNVVLRRKPQSTFCVSVRPWLHSDVHLGSLILDPEDIRILNIGAIWNFAKGTGLFNLVPNMGHKGLILRLRCIGPGRAQTQIPFHSIQTPCCFMHLHGTDVH
jgi:hypothetical protein